MRERFIRISHAMRIFFLLYGVAAIVRRVQQFCREPISHCFFATSAGIENNPADCEGAAAFLMNFNRNLIGGSSYAARLHFDSWSDVFNRPFEKLQRFVAGLFANLTQGIIERSFGNRTLPAPHDSVDKLGHQWTVVNRIREHGAPLCNSTSRHKLLRASFRTFGAIL